MKGLLTLVAVQAAQALAPSPQRARAFIESVLPGSQIPGLAVAVVQQGNVLYTDGFGVKDASKPASGDNLVTADTLFEIGSCTKTFIAMGLAQFVTSGRITWETPVSSVLTWFQAYDSYMTKNINIADLLAHRTGLGDHDGDMVWLFGGVSTEEDLVRKLQYLPPRTSMRDTFMYSNIGFEIATVVLQNLAGTSWAKYIAGSIFQPLGMKNTAASFLDAYDKTAMAAGHYVWYANNASEQIVGFDYFASTTPKLSPAIPEFGAGSIISTANDYAKWINFLVTSKNSSIAAMESGQMIVPLPWVSLFMMLKQNPVGNSFAAGFGFDVVGRTFYDQRFFTKGGDTLFHKTRSGFLPDSELAVSLMVNLEGDYVTEVYVDAIRNGLLQIFQGDSDAQVQDAWAILQQLISTQRAQIPSTLPNNTLTLPLKIGTATYNYRTYLAPQDQNRVIEQCGSAGLPPFQAVSAYQGTFFNPYYGQLTVNALPNGLLNINYGVFTGTACRLSLSQGPSEDFLWPNATTTSALFSSAYIPLTFSAWSGNKAQNVNFIGIDFDRTSNRVKVHALRSPSLLPWSLV